MTSESIGQRLTRHREAMGLTTTTAAARLHCDESIIVSLEADRFAEIGARVFAQGHLRRYADLVGAPTAELMADWAEQGASLAAPDLTKVPRTPMPAVNSQAWARRLGIVAAAVVIAVAAWWILQGAGVSEPAAQPNAAAQQPVAMSAPEVSSAPAAENVPPASDVPVATPVVTSPVEPPSLTNSPNSAAAPPVAAPIAAPVVAPVVASSSAVVPGRVVIAIDARADCWVEIYDSSGRKLYFDNVNRGGQARAAGQGPLRVLLGRADVASLQVAGRPVAIPANFIRNSTAYFTVDASANLRPFAKPSAPMTEQRP
jgi:cytoskeleton protein RodZ